MGQNIAKSLPLCNDCGKNQIITEECCKET